MKSGSARVTSDAGSGSVSGKGGHGLGQERISSLCSAPPCLKKRSGPGRSGLQLPGLGGEIRRIDENPGGAVPEDVGQLRHGQAEVEGRHDRPRLGAGEEDLEKLGGVGHQHRDPLAPADPPGRQRVGHPVHPLVELAVREGALVLLLQERPIRIGHGALENPFPDIHPITPPETKKWIPRPSAAACRKFHPHAGSDRHAWLDHGHAASRNM